MYLNQVTYFKGNEWKVFVLTEINTIRMMAVETILVYVLHPANIKVSKSYFQNIFYKLLTLWACSFLFL